MYTVTVAFRDDKEYEFRVHTEDIAGLTRDSARECTPSNPVGKVLILDVILNVAKYGGESRFAQGGAWSCRFAASVALALDRPVVRIDLPGFVVG